jgi:hypothetical protein
MHLVEAGDGIRCWIFSSREGMLNTRALHNQQQPMNVESVSLHKGDTLDFAVDINGQLNSDQYLWAPMIREVPSVSGAETPAPNAWEAARDFSAPTQTLLTPWEQLAQVLLISNELMFVD